MEIFFLLFTYLIVVGITIGKRDDKRLLTTILSAFGLWLVLALRSPFNGVDLYREGASYLNVFRCIQNYSFSEILNHRMSFTSIETGWLVFTKIISLITSHSQFYLAIVAAFGLGMISTVIYKYAKNISLAFIIYAAFGIYVFSFSGIRQHTALSITFFSFIFIMQRKLWLFLTCVFLAATIHSSALIFLPVYFLKNIEMNSKRCLLIVLVFCAVSPFLRTIVPYLSIMIFGNSRYLHYQDEGGAITMFLVYALLFLASFFARAKDNSKFQLYQWIILLATMSQGLGLISAGAITRVGYYFSVFFTLYLTQTISFLRFSYDRNIVNVGIAFAMILFFYLTNKGGYLNVVPYHFFWEPGYSIMF